MNAAMQVSYQPQDDDADEMLPLADRLFVRIAEAQDEERVVERADGSKGRIIMPKTRRDVVSDGEVIAVGPEVEVLRPGDRVLKVDVLGVDCGSRPGVVERHPELKGVFVLREHEVTGASGPGLKRRMREARERGANVGLREPSRSGRW